MALNWPSNPSVGDTYTSPGGTVKYEWTGVAWDAVGTQTDGGGNGSETIFAGVERIIAGTNVTVSPEAGSGIVTISAAAGSNTTDVVRDADWPGDRHWNDCVGDTSDAKLRWFLLNDNRDQLFIPPNTTITLTGDINVPSERGKVGINGPASALGKLQPKIRLQSHSIKFKAGARLIYLSFEKSANTGTGVTFGETGSDAEDDIDSSVKNCTFNVGGGNIGVRFNGRNVLVQDCSFSDGVGMTAIRMTWDNIDTGSSELDDLNENSWRKNRIVNNQFHINRASTAVLLDGDNPCQGLLVANNILDIGGSLLRVTGGGLHGATIVGNSVTNRQNTFDDGKTKDIIYFESGQVKAVNITGNTLTGREDGEHPPRDIIRSDVSPSGLAVTGNSMGFCTGYAVNLTNGTSGCVVVGNTIRTTGYGSGNDGVNFSDASKVGFNI